MQDDEWSVNEFLLYRRAFWKINSISNFLQKNLIKIA